MPEPDQKLQGLRVFGEDALSPSRILPDSFIVSAGLAGGLFTLPSFLLSSAEANSGPSLGLGYFVLAGLILSLPSVAFCAITSFFSFLLVHTVDWSLGRPMTRKLVFSISGGLALASWAMLLSFFVPPASTSFQFLRIAAAATIGGAVSMKITDIETPPHRLQSELPLSFRFTVRQLLISTGWLSLLLAIDGGNLRLISLAAAFACGIGILWGVAYWLTAMKKGHARIDAPG